VKLAVPPVTGRRAPRPSRNRGRPVRTPARRCRRTRRWRRCPDRWCGSRRPPRRRRARRPPGRSRGRAGHGGRTPAEKTTTSRFELGAAGQGGEQPSRVPPDRGDRRPQVHGDAEVLDHLAEQGAAAPRRLAAALSAGPALRRAGTCRAGAAHGQPQGRAARRRPPVRPVGRGWSRPRAGAAARITSRSSRCGRRSIRAGPFPGPAGRTGKTRWQAPARRTEDGATAGGDGAGGPVDGGHRLVQAQHVAGRAVAPRSDDIEVSRGRAVEVRRQRDPVVGAARLLRQHGNPPRLARIAVPPPPRQAAGRPYRCRRRTRWRCWSCILGSLMRSPRRTAARPPCQAQ